MRKILLATVSVLAFAGAAGAADMPVRMGAPVAPCAAQKFHGVYLGVHGGGLHWTANRTDQDEVLVDVATIVQKEWSWVVGGQAGYNFTTCNALFGIEIDGSWSNAEAHTQLIPNASPLLNLNINSQFDGLATARLRTGIVIDNLLLFVSGGVAGGHFKTTYTNQFAGITGVVPGFLFQASFDDWRFGWVAGVGTEWAFAPNWSFRSEVLYVEFADDEKRTLFAPPATFANFTQSDSMWISRVGVNYRFGPGVP
jgi:outer membrane immunogenic protein